MIVQIATQIAPTRYCADHGRLGPPLALTWHARPAATLSCTAIER